MIFKHVRKIVLDLDDVLVDTMPSLITFCNERYKTNLLLEDMHSYHFWEAWGCTRKEAIRRVYEFARAGKLRCLYPIPGAVDTVRSIIKWSDLTIVTSRPSEFANDTYYILERYFPELVNRVVFCSTYEQNRSTRSKREVCHEVGAHLIIDDNLDHILECTAAGIPGIVFGNYPWNRIERSPLHLKRADTWHELQVFLRKSIVKWERQSKGHGQ